jgi:hypothetical protein
LSPQSKYESEEREISAVDRLGVIFIIAGHNSNNNNNEQSVEENIWTKER